MLADPARTSILMSQQDAFDRIVAALHDAALDDAQWPAASALIDDACRMKGNMLVHGDGDSSQDIEIFFARLCYHGQRHDELERLYFTDYHPTDERVPRLRQLPDRRLVHVRSLYGERSGDADAVGDVRQHRHSRCASSLSKNAFTKCALGPRTGIRIAAIADENNALDGKRPITEAWRELALSGRLELLAQPSHRPIQVVQAQIVDPRDGVVAQRRSRFGFHTRRIDECTF